MKLTCPHCQKPVPTQDVNIKLGVAKCLACDAVFSLVSQIGTPMPGKRNERPLAPPENFRIDDIGSEITVQWRWCSDATWILLMVAILWNAFLILYYGVGVGDVKGGKQQAAAWLMFVFPILHVAVGVFLIYVVLLSFVNRTVIKIARGELSVWHGPLPAALVNCRMPTADIAQLFCSEQVHRSKRKRSSSRSYSYSVNALLTSGERMSLITSLHDSFEALYLERFLEEKLKIANQHVPGEFRG
jgi:hypothetical protein